MVQKEELRGWALQNRADFSNEYVAQASEQILAHLKKLKLWENKQTTHIYLPIKNNHEIDTWPVIKWLIQIDQEVWSSYLPSNQSEDGFCRVEKTTKYKQGRFDIPLPQSKVVKHIDLTVIIVPCVAVDKNGNRLGYGSGWYDRFLSDHPAALRIGLVYDELVINKINADQHDQKLQVLVTPGRTVWVGAK